MNSFHFNVTQDVWHGVAIIFICCVLTIVAVLLDLHSGVTAARKACEKLRSHIFRRTIGKTVDYFRMIFFGVMIDILGLCFPWYEIPYCTILVTLGVLLIEAKSVHENNVKAKSAAAALPDKLQAIVNALTTEDAKKIYKAIKEQSDDKREA